MRIINIIALFCFFALFSCSKAKTTTTPSTPAQACYVVKDKEFSGNNFAGIVYYFHYDSATNNLTAIAQRDTLGNILDSMGVTYTNGKPGIINDYGTGKFTANYINLTYNSGGLVSQYTYTDKTNQVNDFYNIYNYNSSNQLTTGSQNAGTSNGSPISFFSFGYDKYGNVNNVALYNDKDIRTDSFVLGYDANTSRWATLPQGIKLILGSGLPYSKANYNAYLNNNNLVTIYVYGASTALLSTGTYSYQYSASGQPDSYKFNYTSQHSRYGSITYNCK